MNCARIAGVTSSRLEIRKRSSASKSANTRLDIVPILRLRRLRHFFVRHFQLPSIVLVSVLIPAIPRVRTEAHDQALLDYHPVLRVLNPTPITLPVSQSYPRPLGNR